MGSLVFYPSEKEKENKKMSLARPAYVHTYVLFILEYMYVPFFFEYLLNVRTYVHI
jgi:hypothetical protein